MGLCPGSNNSRPNKDPRKPGASGSGHRRVPTTYEIPDQQVGVAGLVKYKGEMRIYNPKNYEHVKNLGKRNFGSIDVYKDINYKMQQVVIKKVSVDELK